MCAGCCGRCRRPSPWSASRSWCRGSPGISPGFLFGIVLGVVYARELKLRDEGRLGALGVGPHDRGRAARLAGLRTGVPRIRTRLLEQPGHRDLRRDHARGARHARHRAAADRLPRRADDLPLVEARLGRALRRDPAGVPLRGGADVGQLGRDVRADLRMGHPVRRLRRRRDRDLGAVPAVPAEGRATPSSRQDAAAQPRSRR